MISKDRVFIYLKVNRVMGYGIEVCLSTSITTHEYIIDYILRYLIYKQIFIHKPPYPTPN